MNILFLTMNPFTDIEMHNIYSDLMKVFIEHGHRPYIVTPREKSSGEQTELLDFDTYSLLKVRVGNTSGVSLIEKGISTVTLSGLYYRAVKKYLSGISFGLILYSTPPITLYGPVRKLKRDFRSRTYLMLKDIFPQNAVDLAMFGKGGLLYRYFRGKEKGLYRVSDAIGCMSQANVDYLMHRNPEISADKVEICANAILPHPLTDRTAQKAAVREQYDIPREATVYLYGGNLGKPQGIDHLIRCLDANAGKSDRFFIICGSGSEYPLLEAYIRDEHSSNVRLIRFLPKDRYDALAAGCDVGLIFLDSRFTIPNYPSRILSYMENAMPVVVCSDDVTDVGTDAERGGYGYTSSAKDVDSFTKAVDKMNASDIAQMGKAAREYLEQHFDAHDCYNSIMGRCEP